MDFGELRFSSSRAYDELEDDESSGSITKKYNLVLDLTNPEEMKSKMLKCSMMIVSYGTLATDFCETFLSEQCANCGTIKVEEEKSSDLEDTSDFRPRKLKPTSLSILQNSVLVCKVSQDITAVLANRFADMVLSLVSPECKVLVMSSHHYSKLQGAYTPLNGGNCTVHSLRSPLFTNSPAFPKLPQPATIDSVPAAMLTECIVKPKPCVLYPVFTETYSTGDLDLVVDSLIKIFHQDPFKNILPFVNPSKLHQYRAKNSRKEMLDRYM